MLSGGTNDSTSAPAAGVPDTQSKTLPASLVRGIAGPVEKKVDAPVLRTFPRRSESPLIMITVYEVLERHPCVGLTPISPGAMMLPERRREERSGRDRSGS